MVLYLFAGNKGEAELKIENGPLTLMTAIVLT